MLHYVDGPVQRAVVSIGPVLAVIVHALFPALVYKRRHCFPLNRRSLGLFFASNLAVTGYLLCIFTLISTGWSPPCLLHYYPHSSFGAYFVFLIVFRSITLLFQYKLDGDVKKFQARSTPDPMTGRAHAAATPKISCFARNRRFIVGRWRWINCGIAFVILFAIYPLSMLPIPAGESPNDECDAAPGINQRVLWCANVIPAVLVVVQLICALLVHRFPKDLLGVRREILSVALVSVFGVGLNWALRSQPDPHDDLRWSLTWLIIELISAVQALTPLYMTYKFERQQRNALQRLDSAKHLRDVLALPEGYAAYLQFAVLEFSSVKPLFWRTAAEFVEAVARRAMTTTVRDVAPRRDSFAALAGTPVAASAAQPMLRATPADADAAALAELSTQAQGVFDRFLADDAPFAVEIPPLRLQAIQLHLRGLRDGNELENSVSLTIAGAPRSTESGWTPSMTTRSPSSTPHTSRVLLQRLRDLAASFDEARECVLLEMHQSDFDRFLLSRAFAQLTSKLAGPASVEHLRSAAASAHVGDETRARRREALEAAADASALALAQEESQASVSPPAAVRAIADPSRRVSLEASLTGVLVGPRSVKVDNCKAAAGDSKSSEPQLPGVMETAAVAT